MKNIFSIYTNDLIRIWRSWAALVMVAGLIVLPSLYAWFNIESSWDPYGNTSGIKVAVANNDTGAAILGHNINAGESVVNSLRANTKIGWVFTNEEQALNGVKKGNYYASIVIPADFSEKLASIITDVPVRPELQYYVNEKINAVAPKITSSGASSIVSEIGANFVETANGVIFKGFNELGIKLEQELPSIEKVKSLVFRFEDMMPELRNAAETAQKDIGELQQMTNKAEDILPDVQTMAEDATQFASRLGDVLGRTEEVITTASPLIRENLGQLSQAVQATAAISESLADSAVEPDQIRQELEGLRSRLTLAQQLTQGAKDWTQTYEAYIPSAAAKTFTEKLEDLNLKLTQQLELIDKLDQAADNGEDLTKLLGDFQGRAAEMAAASTDLLDRYDTDIAPSIESAVSTAAQKTQKANDELQAAIKLLPDVSRMIQDAKKGLTLGGTALQSVMSELPAAEQKIHQIADEIRKFEQTGNLQEIIDLLKNDFEKESAFFASPVSLKENKLFPIPNYGSAMSPFFTTLSLWVGGLLLVSLLSVEVDTHPSQEREDGEPAAPYRPYQVYFGRYLTFLTVGLLQSLVVTLGDLWILHTYVHDPLWFVIFGLLISAVFMLIVYTLVSVFGNVGKAMAIVLLVLQLGGAGGTFPIEVTPVFFQWIHPFLPFTYGISLMREAVGGMLPDVVARDIVILLVIAGIFVLLGLLLKKSINRLSAPFVKKAKESRLIH
ncbi:YhgE/Pip domain-containing protein [Neobacillus mesonae]|nr:YhgE/Pip domain-containing protein [Neobacillus mesonae]